MAPSATGMTRGTITLFLPFVDRLIHYLSTCPIKHLPKPLVSCSSQGSTIQESSPHKCSQKVWWDALNVVAATIPSIISRLTPSLKLFIYNLTSFGNVPLTWPYCLSVWPPRHNNGLLSIIMHSSSMDTTRGTGTLFKFLCHTNKNTTQSLVHH